MLIIITKFFYSEQDITPADHQAIVPAPLSLAGTRQTKRAMCNRQINSGFRLASRLHLCPDPQSLALVLR